MNIYFKHLHLAFIGIAAWTAPSALGAPMTNCGRQKDCIAITSVESAASKCDHTTCEFKVCMKIDQTSSGSCVKSGSISHTCVKKNDVCQNDSNSFAKSLGVAEVQSIPNGHEQCQYAGPGQTVQFLLKDGGGCDANGGGTASITLGGLPGSCRPRNSTTTSCTGNGLQKECIWEFVTPSCSGSSTIPAPTNPSPTSATTPVAPQTTSAPIVKTPTSATTTVAPQTTSSTIVKTATTSPPNVSPPPPSGGGANGDPHIKTWNGQNYDFHGVCDLVLLHNPGFMDGLGMDIHMRTKRTLKYFSYINTAVLRIGDSTLEIMGKAKHNLYWINGVAGDQLVGDTVLSMTLSGFPIQYKQLSPREQEYSVLLGDEKIVFQTWNSMVRVDVVNPTAENFATSVGLMGTFSESLKMARDNQTIIEDLDEFGQEWQVLPSESKLFHKIDGPQAPTPCEVPSATELRRHLSNSQVSREAAELACASVKNTDEFDLCVFDVIATSDQNVAGAY